MVLQCKDSDIKSILIKKNSELGRFILNNNDLFTDYISYSDVINALNISILEDDVKMANKLMHPFKEKVFGKTSVFLEKYGEKVVDYIKNNNDLDLYLEEKDGKKKEFVYDNFKVLEKDNSNSSSVKVYKRK
jgi:hypothetical protein